MFRQTFMKGEQIAMGDGIMIMLNLLWHMSIKTYLVALLVVMAMAAWWPAGGGGRD